MGSGAVSSHTLVEPDWGMVHGHGGSEAREEERETSGGMGGDGVFGIAGLGGMQHREQYGGDGDGGDGRGIQHVRQHHVVGDVHRPDAELCGVAIGLDEHVRSTEWWTGTGVDGVYFGAIRLASGAGFHRAAERDCGTAVVVRKG